MSEIVENFGIVVVGLGNPILSDDAVGLHVAQEVAARSTPGWATVLESSRGGLDLVDLIAGYGEAHLIDALLTDAWEPGEIVRLGLDRLPTSLTLGSSHEVDLPTAMELARRLGYEVPSRLTIWAIAVVDPFTVSERLSPEVAAAVTGCADRIIEAISDRRVYGKGR